MKNIVLLSIVAFGLSLCDLHSAQAVTPPPDGGYPNANTAEGTDALFSLTDGTDNTALGFQALYNNETGFSNTAVGSNALFSLTEGTLNTAIGSGALKFDTTGFGNTATGCVALNSNTTGTENTATGRSTLYLNTSGGSNTAIGSNAMYANTSGGNNTATGKQALYLNTTGSANTATGVWALLSNTTGNYNTANGYNALFGNTTGSYNTATGLSALYSNNIGYNNTAIGYVALSGNTTGYNNIAVGQGAGEKLTTGNDNINIGNKGLGGESRTIRIGTRQTHRATYIAGISGATVPTGVGVIVDADGHLGTVTSSQRFKGAIKPVDKASEAILSLKPVTFRYKHEFDPAGIPQFGLVAEQVEKVNPDLVARDEQGKPYTVRYEAVNAMLLNEFLKEHHKVEALQTSVAQQRKEFRFAVAQLQSILREQSARLQDVSDQLHATKPGRRLASITNKAEKTSRPESE